MIVQFYGRQTISNPIEVLAWALSVGRIAAADYSTWLTNLTGNGAQAYYELLFAVPGSGTIQLPSGTKIP